MRMALRNTWAVFLRDLGGYFLSPMAWIVIFLFLMTNGVMFYAYAELSARAGDPRQVSTIIEQLFGFALIWVIPLSPLLTMRLFAEEKRTGTFEMLMTAPVTEWQVILGKLGAAQVFYFLIWLSLAPLFVILSVLGDPDWGPVVAMYAGLFFLGLLTNSLGLLASVLTRNQLVAAVLALTGNLFFFVISLAQAFFREDPDSIRLIQYASFTHHFSHSFSRGLVDLRHLFFYASFAAFFLFFTARALEARRWR
jgi:ABC-2 type transport system permease protein